MERGSYSRENIKALSLSQVPKCATRPRVGVRRAGSWGPEPGKSAASPAGCSPQRRTNSWTVVSHLGGLGGSLHILLLACFIAVVDEVEVFASEIHDAIIHHVHQGHIPLVLSE